MARSGFVGCHPAAGRPILKDMPLLTELVSVVDGFCYRHGAPCGAFRDPPAAR